MEDIKGLTDRFIKFFEYGKKAGLYKSAADFCRKIDIKPTMLNEVVKGRSKVGIQIIQNTVSTFGILDTTWLFTGKGEMIREADLNGIRAQNYEMQKTLIELQQSLIKRLQAQIVSLGHIPVE